MNRVDEWPIQSPVTELVPVLILRHPFYQWRAESKPYPITHRFFMTGRCIKYWSGQAAKSHDILTGWMIIRRISPQFHTLILHKARDMNGQCIDVPWCMWREFYFFHLFSGTVIGLPVDDSREVTIPTLQHHPSIQLSKMKPVYRIVAYI